MTICKYWRIECGAKQWVALAALVWLCLGAGGQAAADPLLQWQQAGELAVSTARGGPHCQIFYPDAPSAGPLPLIIWGNGTGASPLTYEPLLRHWASHGFVVVAAMTPNAGRGWEMRRCLAHMVSEQDNADSPFFGRLNLASVGNAGHSQGGGGALMSSIDPLIRTTVAIQPHTLDERHDARRWQQMGGALLLLSGAEDFTVDAARNHQPVFEAANQPVFWATLEGAHHFTPLGGAGAYRGVMTAWFAWQLRSDEAAAALFRAEPCQLCQHPQWVVQSTLP